MTEIRKINDNTVAEIGTREVRRIYSSTQLADRKVQLEEELARVIALQDALR